SGHRVRGTARLSGTRWTPLAKWRAEEGGGRMMEGGGRMRRAAAECGGRRPNGRGAAAECGGRRPKGGGRRPNGEGGGRMKEGRRAAVLIADHEGRLSGLEAPRTDGGTRESERVETHGRVGALRCGRHRLLPVLLHLVRPGDGAAVQGQSPLLRRTPS